MTNEELKARAILRQHGEWLKRKYADPEWTVTALVSTSRQVLNLAEAQANATVTPAKKVGAA